MIYGVPKRPLMSEKLMSASIPRQRTFVASVNAREICEEMNTGRQIYSRFATHSSRGGQYLCHGIEDLATAIEAIV